MFSVNILVQYRVRELKLRSRLVFHTQNLPFRRSDRGAITSAKMVPIQHDPSGMALERVVAGFARIFTSSGRGSYLYDFKAFDVQSLSYEIRRGCHQETYFSTRLPPRLGQSQTAHHMAGAYCQARISAD